MTEAFAETKTQAPAPPAIDESAPFAPRVWVITNGNQGSDAQATGLVQALGVDAEYHAVSLSGLHKAMAPGGPVPWGHVGKRGKLFAPPWPDIVISVGRVAAPYAQKIRRLSKGQTFAIALQNPRTKLDKWDFVWAPEHDRLEGPNVFTTLTSPHRLTAQNIAAAAKQMQGEIDAMPRPRIAVLIGGPNGAYRFSPRLARTLTDKLEQLAPGGSFLITTSRRTPEGVAWTIREWMGGKPARLWQGGAANPYLAFLGLADAIVVTADSVNMAGEAASTGKPVYVLDLPGHAPKFRKFHRALEATGATRPLDGKPFQAWDYDPVDPNTAIAQAAKRAYLAWTKTR